MIDKKSGNLILSPNVRLKPFDSLADIRKLELGKVREVRDLKNSYSWLTIQNLKVKKEYFLLDLCFQNKRLTEISLIPGIEEFNIDQSWESWDEKEEKRKVLKFKKWIIHELGRTGKFDWGEVWVGYDDKSAASSIVITYHSVST